MMALHPLFFFPNQWPADVGMAATKVEGGSTCDTIDKFVKDLA